MRVRAERDALIARIEGLREKLESRDFYEVMKTYRHTPLAEHSGTVIAFEAVKSFLLNALLTSSSAETKA